MSGGQSFKLLLIRLVTQPEPVLRAHGHSARTMTSIGIVIEQLNLVTMSVLSPPVWWMHPHVRVVS